MLRLIAVAALFAQVLVPAAAEACSPQIGYRAPSNFELVHDADLIVLARVGSESENPGDFLPAVRLQTLDILKGTAPEGPLFLRGRVGSRSGPALPHPTALNELHPSTLHGACIRAEYAPDAMLVAMFKRTPDGGYRQIEAAFARVAEDVEGRDALWVRVVREYLAIQAAHPRVEPRAAAEGVLAMLAGRNDGLSEAMESDLRNFVEVSAPRAEWRRLYPVWLFGERETLILNRARLVELRCEAGANAALIVTALDTDGPRDLVLVLDERRFAAEGEIPSELLARPAVAGRIALSPALAGALRTATRAGIEANGAEYLVADPEDALRRFAESCAG